MEDLLRTLVSTHKKYCLIHRLISLIHSTTYVECTEAPSEDPLIEWEQIKARINGSQGGAHAMQVALRTATSKAWCDVISEWNCAMTRI